MQNKFYSDRIICLPVIPAAISKNIYRTDWTERLYFERL